jgi:AcrR family transcriptional regulator
MTLPIEPPRAERADAARNRARILAAAAALFRDRDPLAVTMDEVARAAGVGRATLYRRYPDVASIAEALLGEHERRLQERLKRGDPPLGPGPGAGPARAGATPRRARPSPAEGTGPTPAERLAAFYAAMVEHLEEHLPLILGADAGAARLTVGSYRFWRAHVRSLVIAADATDDPDALADALLAPLAAELYRYQRTQLDLSPERIAAALGLLAHRALTGGGAQPTASAPSAPAPSAPA